ncbi:hypothetical protein [Exiguobacterium sp. ERU656]|uniref:hypothetical protein n=1 Tax=Exiguobacterium sp. ERU656 TaxID=2751217 RepID=UPI000B58D820|nr:hypothetical protein [Exiguobacterium sp. ERU656]ASI36732.1 hypothetical protein A0126_14435 [Exiguobacterium sp. N4-1P]
MIDFIPELKEDHLRNYEGGLFSKQNLRFHSTPMGKENMTGHVFVRAEQDPNRDKHWTASRLVARPWKASGKRWFVEERSLKNVHLNYLHLDHLELSTETDEGHVKYLSI